MQYFAYSIYKIYMYKIIYAPLYCYLYPAHAIGKVLKFHAFRGEES